MSNHIEPSYAGPCQRYTRVHIDGVMVPREVDSIVTCSPDTILIRSIVSDEAKRPVMGSIYTVELINIATRRIHWAYAAQWVGLSVMGGLEYMHFNILHSIDSEATAAPLDPGGYQNP